MKLRKDAPSIGGSPSLANSLLYKLPARTPRSCKPPALAQANQVCEAVSADGMATPHTDEAKAGLAEAFPKTWHGGAKCGIGWKINGSATSKAKPLSCMLRSTILIVAL